MWNMPVICFGQVHWDGYVWICVCSTERQWVTRYRGPERKHLCEDVKPATSYSLRLSCVDVGGQSKVWEPKCINWFIRSHCTPCVVYWLIVLVVQCSDDLTVHTHIPPPGRCRPPRIMGDVKHKELILQWGEALIFSFDIHYFFFSFASSSLNEINRLSKNRTPPPP